MAQKNVLLFSEAWFNARSIESDYATGVLLRVRAEKNYSVSMTERKYRACVFRRESLMKLNRRNFRPIERPDTRREDLK